MDIKDITQKESYLRIQECRGCGGKSTHFVLAGENILVPFCGKKDCEIIAKEKAAELAEYFKKQEKSVFEKFAGWISGLFLELRPAPKEGV